MSSSSNSGGSRVALPDGRWVELRLIRGHDMVAMSGDDYGAVLTRLGEAVVAKSWEGDILEEELPVLTAVMKGWRSRAEEAAVPPASGESSP